MCFISVLLQPACPCIIRMTIPVGIDCYMNLLVTRKILQYKQSFVEEDCGEFKDIKYQTCINDCPETIDLTDECVTVAELHSSSNATANNSDLTTINSASVPSVISDVIDLTSDVEDEVILKNISSKSLVLHM